LDRGRGAASIQEQYGLFMPPQRVLQRIIQGSTENAPVPLAQLLTHVHYLYVSQRQHLGVSGRFAWTLGSGPHWQLKQVVIAF
jgi:hypothetical protein